METGACSCDFDAEWPDVSSAEWRVARKRHLCNACGELIEPGERYEYYTSLYDGCWSHDKTHEACVKIRIDYGCNVTCDGIGYLRMDLAQSLGTDYVTGDEVDGEDGRRAIYDRIKTNIAVYRLTPEKRPR